MGLYHLIISNYVDTNLYRPLWLSHSNNFHINHCHHINYFSPTTTVISYGFFFFFSFEWRWRNREIIRFQRDNRRSRENRNDASSVIGEVHLRGSSRTFFSSQRPIHRWRPPARETIDGSPYFSLFFHLSFFLLYFLPSGFPTPFPPTGSRSLVTDTRHPFTPPSPTVVWGPLSCCIHRRNFRRIGFSASSPAPSTRRDARFMFSAFRGVLGAAGPG